MAIGEWRFDEDLRPASAGASEELIAAGESGILSADTIFRLVDPASPLHQIRELIGDFAALSLWRLARDQSAQIRAKTTRPSRVQIYIPKRSNGRSAERITWAIGTENASRLIEAFAGAIVDLPNGSEVRREQARVCVLVWHREGLSVAEIVDALRPDYPVGEDWVRRLIRDASGISIGKVPR